MSAVNPHGHSHAFAVLNALEQEGLVVASRRSMLKASLAGVCGLSFADVLCPRTEAAETGRAHPRQGGDPPLDDRRPQSDRYLGSQARPAASESRAVRHDLDKVAGRLGFASISRGWRRCWIGSPSSGPWMRTQQPRAERGVPDPPPRCRPQINPAGENLPAIGSVVAKWRGANQTVCRPMSRSRPRGTTRPRG